MTLKAYSRDTITEKEFNGWLVLSVYLRVTLIKILRGWKLCSMMIVRQ